MRVVVKLGTSVLTAGSPNIDRPTMHSIVAQCAKLHDAGHEVVICTSGAVTAGREALNHPALPNTITSRQLLASVGQVCIMQAWGDLFQQFGIQVGQILLTLADIESRTRYLNAHDTLHALIANRIIPIVNENDAVVVEEIKVGDNDNLSARVAMLAEAQLLLLITDQDGLYTADPRKDSTAKLIPEVHEITADIYAIAGGSGTAMGTGGMATKIQSAATATRAGIDVIIARGSTPDIITDVVTGTPHGTRFISSVDHVGNYRKWLLAGTKTVGKIQVDDGAVDALINKGRSLLPIGITHVNGDFSRGDTIVIVDKNGRPIARGVARYTAESLQKLRGKRSDAIIDTLGYTYGDTAVHRNNMILLM